jgi:hypothetical protein
MKSHLWKWPLLALVFLSGLLIVSISNLDTVSGQTASSIWPATAVPTVADVGPDSAAEVGVKFRADVNGFITAIRFYKAAPNTGAHIGNLWSNTGTNLSTVTFANETASGWQQVTLPNPVPITANTVYVASYHTNGGHYSDDENYFTGQGVDNPPLHALAAGVSDPNGVYAYGATSQFPDQDYSSSNYWVDVVFITTTTTLAVPEPAGWFTGDIHVHRSCGGSPEDVSSLYSKMNPNNLAVMSLLADSGNGQVLGATTDLPLVNGSDASISIPGRIVHWDTEWHWDATYAQSPHQALGGHIVALGLTEAHQIWQESTYQILNWAHQQNGIAGFAHLQYLDGGIPQTLTCCTPIEYPVEVALGAADFISEDVDDSGSGFSMFPESATQAYYKLLNTGFRPGFAAGTDYPCNNSRPLGDLLTYVQVAGGQMTYRNWIEGIRSGRTVVSRNGHKEFLSLTVNGTATPGDEIDLTAAATLPVSVKWTATENLSGTIEVLSNGAVVASQQASATASIPVVWNTSVDFPKSGWVVARRMGADGHQVHTAAVFVIINGMPIRASASDAEYFVLWTDNLLTNTSPGGPWTSFFPTTLSQAQARYQSARAIFQQILTEAEGTTPPPGTTIFTTQTPPLFEHDSTYELGTKFWSDVNGQIAQVRLYASAQEGGSHTVRIWQVNTAEIAAGPYPWNITFGTEGWKTFTLPAPLSITANTDYIVAISNSSDQYAEQIQGLASPIDSGHLHTYTGSGLYSTTLGTMPTLSWQNANYFRDIVFAPQ